MRQFFVICLLLVLPLRGFVGDAMAYEMLMSDRHPPAAQKAATEPGIQQPGERAPCHMASAPADGDELQQSNCTAC